LNRGRDVEVENVPMLIMRKKFYTKLEDVYSDKDVKLEDLLENPEHED